MKFHTRPLCLCALVTCSAPREQFDMSVTKILFLDKISPAGIQDFSLNISVYTFKLCMYVYLYAFVLHILK